MTIGGIFLFSHSLHQNPKKGVWKMSDLDTIVTHVNLRISR